MNNSENNHLENVPENQENNEVIGENVGENTAVENTNVEAPQQVNPPVETPAPQNNQTTSSHQPQIVKKVEKKEVKKVVEKQAAPQQTPPSNNSNQSNQTVVEKKPSAFRYVLLVLLFVLLGALIWFLPDIRKFVTEKNIKEQKEVINGTLKCTYEEESEPLSTSYTSEFVIENNNLKSYTSKVETKGSEGSEADLDELNQSCELLKDMAKDVSGVKISCNLNSRVQMNEQEIDYREIDEDELESAYSEAGGIVPNYSLDDDGIEIRDDMVQAGYSCTVN